MRKDEMNLNVMATRAIEATKRTGTPVLVYNDIRQPAFPDRFAVNGYGASWPTKLHDIATAPTGAVMVDDSPLSGLSFHHQVCDSPTGRNTWWYVDGHWLLHGLLLRTSSGGWEKMESHEVEPPPEVKAVAAFFLE